MGRVGILVLSPILVEFLQVYLHSIWYWDFICSKLLLLCLEVGHWISDFSNTFNMRGCCISSNAFSASKEMIMWFFSFEFAYIVAYVNGFSYIEPTLYPWDSAYLIIMNDDVFLESVCKNFIEYFCMDIHKWSWSEVLFFGWFLVWFRYQRNCGSLNWVR